MSKTKRKKHDHAALLKYMHLLDDGYSFDYIRNTYGIDGRRLAVLRSKYLQNGPSVLYRKKNIKADFHLKRQIVLDIEKNHVTLSHASLKYDVSASQIKVWLRIARGKGIDALKLVKKRGGPPGMGRPRKNSKPLTEIEQLRKEVQELRTENALLKKVRALVEERNARLREIGHGPSKN